MISQKAPKEFHSQLDDLYNQIYRDRKKSNKLGTAKTREMLCKASTRIIPLEMPFKSKYDCYILSLSESEISNSRI